MLCVASDLRADVLPEGCYKADGSNQCYEPSDDQILLLNPAVYGDNLVYIYGVVLNTVYQAWWHSDQRVKSLAREIRKLKHDLTIKRR